MPGVPPSGSTRVLSAAVAPFILLLTPFAIFVQYQRYGWSHPEMMLFVLALAGTALLLGAAAAWSRVLEVAIIAALLTLFADLQLDEPGEKKLALGFVAIGAVVWLIRQHAARIIVLTVGTVLVLSLVPPRLETSATGSPARPSRADLPLLIHLVLDEHIGIEGLPKELTPPPFRSELESFFTDRRFMLFGRAYSEYPSTLWSLSHLLNLSPGGYVRDLSRRDAAAATFRLNRNAYFARLVRQGYAIHVFQPEYLDVCTSEVSPSACYTYRANGLGALDHLDAPPREKLSVVAGTFLARSEGYGRLKRLYRQTRRWLLDVGIPVPAWDWERSSSAPVGTMPVIERVAAEISKAGGGQLMYAHLLLPHYPYVYDADCRARPPSQWLMRGDSSDAGVPGEIINSHVSRAARYTLYLEQLLCAQRKIERIIDSIPPVLRDDAILIVQGDHGSRISLVDPITTTNASMGPADYTDHFSTLFAVRSPHLAAAYDGRLTPITCLLRTLVESDFRSASGTETCSTNKVVYFFGGVTPSARPFPEHATWLAGSPATASPAGLKSSANRLGARGVSPF